MREFKQLRQAQPRTGGGQEIDRLKSQVELQQKQIDVLLKMTQLLAEQMKKQAAAGAAVEKLQEQVATQEARIQQARMRDQELARSRDELVERLDAEARKPVRRCRPTLRELFSPTRNNESPLCDLRQRGSRSSRLQPAEQHLPRPHARAPPLPASQ